MAGKYVDMHGNIAFRFYHCDARSHEPPSDTVSMPSLFKHASIQSAILEEFERGVPQDDIWDSLWSVLRSKHPQMSNEDLDAWVNKLTRPIY